MKTDYSTTRTLIEKVICFGFKQEMGSRFFFFFPFKGSWKKTCKIFARVTPEQLEHMPAEFIKVSARQQIRLNLLLPEPELRWENAQADG